MGIGPPKSKKPMSAAALFLNQVGQILLVEPTYKDHWLMPGGETEDGESPADCCIREIKEELSLDLKKDYLRLISIDYVLKGTGSTGGDALRFLFFGGELSVEQIKNIKFPPSELKNMGFFNISDLSGKLQSNSARRLEASFEAYKNNNIIYLEDGYKVM